MTLLVEQAAATWWDGVPCRARRCVVEVLDPSPGRPTRVWYAHLIGTEQPAVEVHVPDGISPHAAGRSGGLLYVHDGDGWGWRKVTQMRGHRGVVHGHFHRVRVLAYFD